MKKNQAGWLVGATTNATVFNILAMTQDMPVKALLFFLAAVGCLIALQHACDD